MTYFLLIIVSSLARSSRLSMTSNPAPSLCGWAKDKAELFRERYTILQQVSELCSNHFVHHCLNADPFFPQRIHRHELFTPPAIGTAVEEGQNKFQVWLYPKTTLLMRGSLYSCRRETTFFSDISCVCHLF